jgi:tetratricopeptide (TPR) repeat protein
VTEDIRVLTQRLADEPGSLAFLELAEALRRRGQLDAAHKVARGGLNRYPGLADAHDLMGRILSDRGDLAGAFDAWADALRFDPMRTGALKGIAFLYFKAGDTAAALEHLARAAEADPDDPAIAQAIARIRREAREATPGAPASPQEPTPPAAEPLAPEPDVAPRGADTPFAAMEDGGRGLLLADLDGQRLAGGLSDRVAAQLAGVSREATRATRLLGLGSWQSISLEAPDAHLFLTPPTPDTVLLALREPSLPMARLGLFAERASRAARVWLEEVR